MPIIVAIIQHGTESSTLTRRQKERMIFGMEDTKISLFADLEET